MPFNLWKRREKGVQRVVPQDSVEKKIETRIAKIKKLVSILEPKFKDLLDYERWVELDQREERIAETLAKDLEDYESLAKKPFSRSIAYDILAYFAHKAEDYRKEIKMLKKAIKIKGQFTKDAEKARLHYKLAIALHRIAFEPYYEKKEPDKGLIKDANLEIMRALSIADELEVEIELRTIVRQRWALLLGSYDKKNEALKVLKTAIGLAPDSLTELDGRIYCGTIYLLFKEPEKSLHACEVAREFLHKVGVREGKLREATILSIEGDNYQLIAHEREGERGDVNNMKKALDSYKGSLELDEKYNSYNWRAMRHTCRSIIEKLQKLDMIDEIPIYEAKIKKYSR